MKHNMYKKIAHKIFKGNKTRILAKVNKTLSQIKEHEPQKTKGTS